MRILLTGAAGQLGRHLAGPLARLGPVVPVARSGGVVPGARACDLADTTAVDALLDAERPQVVVNTAAWTDVDGAESRRARTMIMNRDLPARLAAWCARHHALLVHYSSDYVFDGSGRRPWRESDPTGPLNVYGESKLAGERAVSESGCRHLVLRTSWVYSRLPGNFLSAILDRARAGQPLQVVADQVGAPTWAASLAAATVHALAELDAGRGEPGLYHVACRGAWSWYEFACRAVAAAAARGALTPPEIRSIPGSQWPQAARRPAYSVMDGTRFETVFDTAMPELEAAMNECIEEWMDSA